MTVNKSLSRGLADRVLKEQVLASNRYLRECALACRRHPRKRGAVQALARELQCNGERASLSQVVANHPHWRWAIAAAFLPAIVPAGLPSTANRAIRYLLLPIHLHAGRRPIIQPIASVALDIREHAIERLFQRLNSMDPESVRDEVHEALCMALHLQQAAIAVGHRQAILPTKSGYFLCSHAKGEPILAKTWVPYSDVPGTREKLARELASLHRSLEGEMRLGEAIGATPYGSVLGPMDRLPEIETLLRRHAWLGQEYESGVDHESLIWDKAREQARHDEHCAMAA